MLGNVDDHFMMSYITNKVMPKIRFPTLDFNACGI